MVTAIVAVAGTLLGSILTYLFQRDTARRTEQRAAVKELRLERLGIYSDFASAIMEFRRAEHDWWHIENGEEDPRRRRDARLESYRLRGQALHSFHRIQLVSPDEDQLKRLALQAYEITVKIHKASDVEDLSRQGMLSRDKLEEFITNAAATIASNRVDKATPTMTSLEGRP